MSRTDPVWMALADIIGDQSIRSFARSAGVGWVVLLRLRDPQQATLDALARVATPGQMEALVREIRFALIRILHAGPDHPDRLIPVGDAAAHAAMLDHASAALRSAVITAPTREEARRVARLLERVRP